MILQDIQEDLVKLYLRLNGYFITGLLLHSPVYGKNRTELDVIAVRFPFHSQEDRGIGSSDFLQIPSDTIDIIVGEVKSGSVKLQFNDALKKDREALMKLVEWIGAFDVEEINDVVDRLQTAMTPEEINTPEDFKVVYCESKSGKFTIRPMLFSLDRPKAKINQVRYVDGQLMLDFIWDCLRPVTIRETCSTTYNTNMWGHSLSPIIDYFKDEEKISVGCMEDYYRYFNLM